MIDFLRKIGEKSAASIGKKKFRRAKTKDEGIEEGTSRGQRILTGSSNSFKPAGEAFEDGEDILVSAWCFRQRADEIDLNAFEKLLDLCGERNH